ncbi:MAG: sensor histidine kinase [Leifsonia sp.]|uniref:sensor histidine kinase n=1 Tax=Leifsonia sp. TaxID=1870902 RepID=UPI003F7E5961
MKALLLRHQLTIDLIVAALFLLLWSMGEVGRHQLVPGTLAAQLPWWTALALVAVAIALCRRLPSAAMAIVVAVLVGQLIFPQAVFAEPGQAVYLGLLLVIVGVAMSARPALRAVTAVFALFVGVAAAGLLAAYGWRIPERIPLFVWCILLCAAAWSVGALASIAVAGAASKRELTRTTSELHEATTEAIIAGERERIAQDVHDIMAHSLSVILAQADGARALADVRPEEMSRSLASIASPARSSLTEVRMLIEGLVSDPDGAEAPSLADIDALVERMRAAGLTVTVERFGEPGGLTATQGLAVYRIVQEALTNALKHGGDGVARVALDGRGGGLTISVSSPAAPSSAPAQPGGRGVHGMRERARLAGGWLDAGPDETDGGYLVTAYIPAAEAVVA